MRFLLGSRLAIVGGLMATAMGTLSADADAVPHLYSYLSEGGNWNVNNWEDCSSCCLGSGRRIYSDSHGYNSSGTLLCTAQAYTAGGWVVNTGNCTGATQHRAMVRRSSLVDCQTGLVSWTTQQNCSADIVTRNVAGPNTCVSRTFRAYSQGTN